MKKSFVMWLLIIGAALFVWASSAVACVCMSKDAEFYLRNMEFVVTGSVMRSGPETEGLEQRLDDFAITMTWKGDISEKIKLRNGQTHSCSADLPVGRRITMGVTRLSDDSYSTSQCAIHPFVNEQLRPKMFDAIARYRQRLNQIDLKILRSSNDLSPLLIKAEFLKDNAENHRAVALYRRLTSFLPDDLSILKGLAEVSLRTHDQRAVAVLERAIAAHPDDADIRAMLDRAREQFKARPN